MISKRLLIGVSLVVGMVFQSSFVAFAAEKKIEDFVLACDVPRELVAGESVDICVLGRAPETEISRDISVDDGLFIEARVILGEGTVSYDEKNKVDGFDVVTFTAPEYSSVSVVKISGHFGGETKELFVSFYTDGKDIAPKTTEGEMGDSETASSEAEKESVVTIGDIRGKENIFTDFADTHKNSNAVYYLRKHDILEGYPDGTLKPNQAVNRAELLKVLIEGLEIDLDEKEFSNCFPDVKTEWFAKYVCYAKEKQWVEGYPKKGVPESKWLFHPAKTVTRSEAVKMLINAYLIHTPDIPSKIGKLPFDDVPEGAWYGPHLSVAQYRGLLEELSKSFKPQEQMTRIKVSEMVYRLLLIKDTDFEVYSDTVEAVTWAQELFFDKKKEGVDFSTGPCLADNFMDRWAIDIVHDPRTVEDHLPENQCPSLRNDTKSNYIELDTEGNLVRVK